jgi:hypothetical protein
MARHFLPQPRATTLDEIIQRPYMLHDIAMEAQRLSAALPPDGWEPSHYRPPGLKRQPHGVLYLVSSSEMGDAENDPLISKPSPINQESARKAANAQNGDSSWRVHVCRWLYWCFSGRQNEG